MSGSVSPASHYDAGVPASLAPYPQITREIAKATKRYVSEEWRLDVSAFACTQNRAWVHLAGRILGRPSATMPVKGFQVWRKT